MGNYGISWYNMDVNGFLTHY